MRGPLNDTRLYCVRSGGLDTYPELRMIPIPTAVLLKNLLVKWKFSPRFLNNLLREKRMKIFRRGILHFYLLILTLWRPAIVRENNRKIYFLKYRFFRNICFKCKLEFKLETQI